MFLAFLASRSLLRNRALVRRTGGKFVPPSAEVVYCVSVFLRGDGCELPDFDSLPDFADLVSDMPGKGNSRAAV